MNEMKRYYSFFTSQPGDWRPCSKEHHDMVRASPQDWPGYEVRELAVIPEGHVVVSEGLLRDLLKSAQKLSDRAAGFSISGVEFMEIGDNNSAIVELEVTLDELRALLNQDKENGNG